MFVQLVSEVGVGVEASEVGEVAREQEREADASRTISWMGSQTVTHTPIHTHTHMYAHMHIHTQTHTSPIIIVMTTHAKANDQTQCTYVQSLMQ